ncbi:MAG: NAD-dependent epimerase/dehydratase family protein [Aggregatilineales bacterium]
MKTLVTGGTGFVGSHLVRVLLAAGHSVRVLHRTSSRLTALEGLAYESIIGDITDLAALRMATDGIDWVFHVAAVADYWRSDVDFMMKVNVEGTRNVLQAARENNVQRIVFTSSAAAIGLNKDIPSDENVPFNLPVKHFPYGYSKVLAEQIVAEAVASGQDIVTVNPVVVIGPGDLNVISGTFILQTKRFGILTPITSGGIAVIDVRDVAAAHLAAAEKGKTGERYILNTANYRYREWFDMIASAVGSAKPRIMTPDFILPAAAGGIDVLRKIGINTPIDANQVRLGDKLVFFDAGKMYQELWQPEISMQQSLIDTYQWYRENGYC